MYIFYYEPSSRIQVSCEPFHSCLFLCCSLWSCYYNTSSTHTHSNAFSSCTVLLTNRLLRLRLFCLFVSHVPVCSCDLVHSGFFCHSGEYICTEDYQRLYGTQCDSCGQYISGEVVSALGRTYHPHCFVCSMCR